MKLGLHTSNLKVGVLFWPSCRFPALTIIMVSYSTYQVDATFIISRVSCSTSSRCPDLSTAALASWMLRWIVKSLSFPIHIRALLSKTRKPWQTRNIEVKTRLFSGSRGYHPKGKTVLTCYTVCYFQSSKGQPPLKVIRSSSSNKVSVDYTLRILSRARNTMYFIITTRWMQW